MSDSLSSESRWNRIWSTFHDALAAERDERRALVQARLDGDATAVDEVWRLLRAHDTGRSPLDRPALSLLDATSLPARVGEWRIQRSLGEGGMGSVSLASRSDGDYEQLAAIKFLDTGAGSDRVFLAERRSLAKLRHPHIAQFYDSGVVGDGLHYLVMEYVDGVPLDHWAEQLRPDLDQRLRLLVSICRAIHFAHRNLVVHLDLKPANILVTAEGVAKVIDFGIASAPDREQDARQAALTPAYASPEQLRGEAPGTASDIFALGVLLHELCSGKRRSVARGDVDARMTQTAARPAALSELTRDTLPAHLRGIGRWRLGELDAIIAVATDSETERRYPSAEAMAADLGRWLVRRPLAVRAPRPGYRLRAWLSRHPLAAAASLAAALALSILMATLFWQSRQLAAALDSARAQTARAEAAAGFLGDLFTQADPDIHLGRPPAVADVLEQGAARLAAIEDPSVRAELAVTLGRAYLNLSEFERAGTMLSTALGSDSNQVRAEALQGLAWVAEERAQLDQAETLQREALELLAGADGDQRGRARLRLSAILQRQGRPADAAAVIADIDAEVDSPELLGDIHIRRGGLAYSGGDFVLAEDHYRQARAGFERAHGRHHHQVARAEYAIAVALHRQARYIPARTHYEQALTLRQDIYGEPHHRVAEVLSAMAALSQDAGDAAAAVETGRRALAMQQALLGADSPRLAQAYNNLGVALHDLGQFEESERYFTEALERHRAARGDGHPHVLSSQANLGLLALDRGDAALAMQRLNDAWDDARAALPEDHFARVGILHLLGRLALEQGNVDRAVNILSEAAALRGADDGSPRPGLADSLYWLAWAKTAQGDLDGAVAASARSAVIRADTLGEIDWRTAASRVQIAALNVQRSDPATSQSSLEDAVQKFVERRGADDWMVAALRQRLAALRDSSNATSR